jgi:tagaturonate reductase
MNDQDFSGYISRLMLEEIAPLVVSDQISMAEATVFVEQVIDRFKNPYIEHLWLNITMQYTSKMAMRTVPLVNKHYEVSRELPDCMALGFAAFIVFMRSTKDAEGRFRGEYNGQSYLIQDDKAILLHNQWQENSFENRVAIILKDETIFGKDLTLYPGFVEAVQQYTMLIQKNGATTTLHSLVAKNNSHE